jgi:hypothetical protein
MTRPSQLAGSSAGSLIAASFNAGGGLAADVAGETADQAKLQGPAPISTTVWVVLA